MTPLKAADGQVYAQAQGNLVIGGARAATGGAATSVNHLSAGRIPGGGIIERAVPALLVDEFVQLDLRRSAVPNPKRRPIASVVFCISVKSLRLKSS